MSNQSINEDTENSPMDSRNESTRGSPQSSFGGRGGSVFGWGTILQSLRCYWFSVLMKSLNFSFDLVLASVL
jgi:hypothetical protein